MKFTLHNTSGAARRGTLDLAHGKLETPAFMPVGTYGTVKAMSPSGTERDGRADRARQYLSSMVASGIGSD
jgi:tRNA-guanine family transglycosylase